jgi:3-methyl-2-oxobutanoate hydroxymethyltransferase
MSRTSAIQLQSKKNQGQKLSLVTCYDATFARLVDQSHMDAILIGDSLGMVIKGDQHTLSVTLDEMIYHCRSVARGSKRVHLIGDMPFGSYQVSTEKAIENAIRLVKEGGVQSIKLEGGALYADLIEKLTRIGIPVMGHLGLTPQSYHQFGGYKLQGKTEIEAQKIIDDAIALEKAGAFAIVLEGIPSNVAQKCTELLKVPTIGIGAGMHCDGQILVIYDLLGLDEKFHPKFLKKYENFSSKTIDALNTYISEVQTSQFPNMAHSTMIDFKIDDDQKSN